MENSNQFAPLKKKYITIRENYSKFVPRELSKVQCSDQN